MGTVTRWLRNLWRTLGSIRLAAALLFALLLASALAGLFPQAPDDPAIRESWWAAVRVRYGPLAGLWRALGLYDLDRSPAFLALLAVLLLNTLACTVRRIASLCRSLALAPRAVRSPLLDREGAAVVEWPVARREDAVGIVWRTLARRGYRVRVEREAHCAHLYAERGRWGRLASPVGHAAAILFFLALLVRSAFWPAVVSLSLFLLATLVPLWLPHRRLWLRVDARCARMACAGDYGDAFDRLAERLSGACAAARAGGDD